MFISFLFMDSFLAATAAAASSARAPHERKSKLAAALADSASTLQGGAGDESLKSQSDEIWAMLDDMAANDPEAYAKFIQEQMDGAIASVDEKMSSGQKQTGGQQTSTSASPPQTAANAKKHAKTTKKKALSTRQPAAVFETPMQGGGQVARINVWIADGGVDAPELPTARAPAVAWEEVRVQVAVRGAPRDAGGVKNFDVEAHEKALRVAVDDAHVGCGALRATIAQSAAMIVERTFGAPMHREAMRYVVIEPEPEPEPAPRSSMPEPKITAKAPPPPPSSTDVLGDSLKLPGGAGALPTHKPSSNEEEPLLREVTTRKPTATAARVEQTRDGVVVRVALKSARGVSLEVVNGNTLEVCVPTLDEPIRVTLPIVADVDGVSAKFDKKEKALIVSVRRR